MKNQNFIQPQTPTRSIACALALLLTAYSSVFNLNQAIAGNGPPKDQELFVEYKKEHPKNTAFIEKYARAISSLDHGQYKTAVKQFKELAKEDPKCVGAWVSQATADLWLEDYQGGIECNTKAIALRPKDADIYRRRALVYIALFKYKEALVDLNQAYKLEPSDFDILKLRASCFKALKRYPEAIADYDRMLKKYPNYEEVLHDKSAVQLEAKDWKNALLTLDVLIKYYPNEETSLLSRASTKIHLQDYKGAIHDYTKVLANGAEAPDYVFSQRAMAYEKLGMKKEAARDRARVHAN